MKNLSKIQLADLNRIVLPILKLDALSLDMSRANTQNWDSLAHINIISAIENEFDLEFDLEEVVELNSIRTILEKIQQKIV